MTGQPQSKSGERRGVRHPRERLRRPTVGSPWELRGEELPVGAELAHDQREGRLADVANSGAAVRGFTSFRQATDTAMSLDTNYRRDLARDRTVQRGACADGCS
jgi:hypothetical protein